MMVVRENIRRTVRHTLSRKMLVDVTGSVPTAPRVNRSVMKRALEGATQGERPTQMVVHEVGKVPF
jgi:hypothetical protein